jgi:hypothetical protein
VLTGALTVDDTFLIHDVVLSDYVGIPELLVLLGYAAVIGSFPFVDAIEDPPKFFGIIAWSYFFIRATLGVVTETHSPDLAPRGGVASGGLNRAGVETSLYRASSTPHFAPNGHDRIRWPTPPTFTESVDRKG